MKEKPEVKLNLKIMAVITAIIALVVWSPGARAQTVQTNTYTTTLIGASGGGAVIPPTIIQSNVLVVVLRGTTASVPLLTVSGTTGTSNTVVTIQQSVDGQNWITSRTMQIANTGTVQAQCISNFTGLAESIWRFHVSNLQTGGAGVLVTNTVSIFVRTKDGS